MKEKDELEKLKKEEHKHEHKHEHEAEVKCHCEDGKCKEKDDECKCDDCGDDCEGECGEDCHCEDDIEEHVHDENCTHEQEDARYKYIVSLEKDLKDAEDKILREKAETINFRRRVEEEQLRFFKYHNEEIIKSVLPIIDNFKRAIDMDDTNLDDELSKFLLGFKMIYNDLDGILKSYEVKEIEALNKPFDANYHNAVSTEKVKDVEPGIVTAVLQKGYMLKDRVIRPAMVKVSE